MTARVKFKEKDPLEEASVLFEEDEEEQRRGVRVHAIRLWKTANARSAETVERRNDRTFWQSS
jgi:hypothetical protein